MHNPKHYDVSQVRLIVSASSGNIIAGKNIPPYLSLVIE
jgi:hypothetical protein